MSHVAERARERYGIDLRPADVAAMVAQIKARKAECLTPHSRTKVFRVVHDDGPIVVIYARGEIVTCLPHEGWL